GARRRRRREVAASRLLPDSEVRRLQVSTSSRLVGMAESVWSERVHLPTAVPGATRAEPGVAWRTGLAWVVMGLVMLIGSRDLFHAGLPAVGSVPLFPSAGDLLGRFTTGWRDTGLGQVTPAPLAFALLGVAGTLLGGSMGLLRDVLTFGMVPLGAIGVWRMARPLGMSEARLVATAVYLAVPLPYDSIANGRWGPLLAYGASPWLLSPLLRSCRRPPFPASSLVLGLLGTGLGLAVTAALVPGEAVALLVAGVGLGVGSLLVGGARALPEAARPVVLAALAGSAAWLLDLPWSLAQVAPGANGGAVLGVPVGVDRAAGVGSLLGLVGRHGATSWVGWCLLVPAALPLLLGRGWRLEWAARLWWVAMACWAAAWAGGRGWFGAPMPDAGVLVAVAAAALAASAGLGVVVFRTDLAGYHFGWRQVSAGLAALGALAAALATVGAAAGGRWGAATTDFSGEVASLGHDARSAGGYRMLWAGEPSAVPVPGWQLQPGFTYATSYDGYPDASAWWPGPDPGAITRAGAALLAAEQSRTVELGHLLAPMGVRYVVVPLAPSPGSSHRAPPPPGLLAGLNAQRDLRPVDLDPLLAVYEDVAWAPTRATLPAPALAAARRSGPSGGLAVDLSTTTPALTDRTGASSFGGVVAPAGLFWSASPAGWSLSEGGSAPVRGRPAFGWATVFPVVGSSSARLVFDTGAGRPVQLAVEGLLWAATIAAVVAGRRRRRRVAVVE
ncbi:MAG TPA: hypothetical protein VFH45_05310, partial [Acidimicrobiales bacterium]|nr:hypothetical protein [Acidimicrobiales bacterium]